MLDSKRIGAGIISLVGLALANDWIVRGFNQMMPFFYHHGGLDWEAVRNVGGFILLAIGLWFLLRPDDKSAAERARERLVENMQRLLGVLDKEGELPPSTFGEMASIYLSLGKLNIVVPTTYTEEEKDTYVNARAYLLGMYPMIRDDHIWEARLQAPHLLEAIGTVKSPKLRTWRDPRSWFG